MKALMLTLLLCCSCTKYAEVSKETMGLVIQPVTMEIFFLNSIDWRVGKYKEAKVSQSFTFITEMPKIKQEDLEYLTEHRNVDSWIIRLIVSRGSQSQDLGSLFTLFKPKSVGRSSQSSSAPSNVTLKVFYAAAFASERFRSFKCPAFSHNKKIESMEIKGTNEEFALNITQAVPYQEKSHQAELTPSAFNGGNSLIGDYFIEIAPYDSRRKMIHAEFKRIPMYIHVKSEKTVRIESCFGVHPEFP